MHECSHITKPQSMYVSRVVSGELYPKTTIALGLHVSLGFTHINRLVNLCFQCHYSLHYLQVSCSTGQHQRGPPFLYTHTHTHTPMSYCTLPLVYENYLVLNMNVRLVLQEQFGNLKVIVLKSPHQWTPLKLKLVLARKDTEVILFTSSSCLMLTSHFFCSSKLLTWSTFGVLLRQAFSNITEMGCITTIK